MYYKGNSTTLIGHEEMMPWPNYTDHMDYELEVRRYSPRRNSQPD
jgi:2-keto-4-pentenoate hydratase/2-oxohepta-3-ene-1,7-dioic acid hydratase in catechol pathway